MKLDLASDTTYINNVGKAILKELRIAEKLLNKKVFNLSDLDSLKKGFSGDYADFYINDRTFQKLQNANESKLIGFDSLYKDVSKYYTVRKMRVLKDTEYIVRESTRDSDFENTFQKLIENNGNGDYPDSFNDGIDERFKTHFPTINTEENQNQLKLNLYNTVEGRNNIRKSYDIRIHSYFSLIKCGIEATALLKKIDSVLKT